MTDRKRLPGVRRTISDVHPYIAGKTTEEVRRELGLSKVVKLGSNENPHAPFPAALDAMQQALPLIHTYPENSFIELRRRIGALYGLSEDHIAVAHGAGGMLETLARMFVQPGDDVLIPGATYGLYREISRFMDGTIHNVPLDRHFRVDLDALTEKVTDRTKLVWLCNPNNPTGTVTAHTDLHRLLDALPSDGWLILDEAYAEFAAPELLPDWKTLIGEGRHVIVVRTFSKAYGLAGARMGYAVAAPETIHAIDTVAEPFNANRIGIAGALATITDGMDSVSMAVAAIISERRRLERELADLGAAVVPSQANFVFFELPESYQCDEGTHAADRVTEELLQKGVIVRSCSGWGFHRHLRVSVGTTGDNSIFLSRLEEVLGG